MNTQYLGSKREINSFSERWLGAKAHFYKPTDVSLLTQMFEAYGLLRDGGLAYTPDTLHTYHPNIVVEPLTSEQGFRPSDKFGIFRMDAVGQLVRPHIKNVQSCHRFNDPTAVRAPFGNLAYMANAWWATYAMFKNKDSRAEWVYETQVADIDTLELPNLVATCNVLFGYDSDGYASAMLSRVYGVYDYNKGKGGAEGAPAVQRLVEYFQFKLHLRVYVAANWLGTIHDQGGRQAVANKRTIITSPKVPIQFGGLDPSAAKSDKAARFVPVYRYPDLDRPLVNIDSNGTTWACEKHEAVSLVQWPNAILGTPTVMFPTTSHHPNSVFPNSGWISIPGYRPGRDQIVCCGSCGNSNEDGKRVHIHDYPRRGLLCDQCASKLMRRSETLRTYIEKDDAVKVLIGHLLTDYLPIVGRNRYFELTTPDPDTEIRYAASNYALVGQLMDLSHAEEGTMTTSEVVLTRDDASRNYVTLKPVQVSLLETKLGIYLLGNTFVKRSEADKFDVFAFAAGLYPHIDLTSSKEEVPLQPTKAYVKRLDDFSTHILVQLSDGVTLTIETLNSKVSQYSSRVLSHFVNEYLRVMDYKVSVGLNDVVELSATGAQITKKGFLETAFVGFGPSVEVEDRPYELVNTYGQTTDEATVREAIKSVMNVPTMSASDMPLRPKPRKPSGLKVKAAPMLEEANVRELANAIVEGERMPEAPRGPLYRIDPTVFGTGYARIDHATAFAPAPEDD